MFMFDAIVLDNQIGSFVHHWQQKQEIRQHQSQILTDADAKELLPYAKQTLMMLDGLLDIVDELNYDKEKFEQLIFKLDDDYEMVRSFREKLLPLLKSHAELAKLSDEILDKLMIAQRELGLIIANNEHNRV